MENFSDETPIAFLTVAQFKSLLTQQNERVTISSKSESDGKRYIYGLAGLAKLIGSSKPTAQKLKDSGKISFVQTGRKIVFDADLVLTELGKIKKGGV